MHTGTCSRYAPAVRYSYKLSRSSPRYLITEFAVAHVHALDKAALWSTALVDTWPELLLNITYPAFER